MERKVPKMKLNINFHLCARLTGFFALFLSLSMFLFGKVERLEGGLFIFIIHEFTTQHLGTWSGVHAFFMRSVQHLALIFTQFKFNLFD